VRFFGLPLLFCSLALAAQSVESCCSITISLETPAGLPVTAAAVRVQSGAIRYEGTTDLEGQTSIALRAPGRYTVSISAASFVSASQTIEIARDEKVRLDFILAPEQKRQDSVTVEERTSALAPESTPAAATGQQLESLPQRIADVRNALPMIPGVVRTPEGKLRISGAPEYRSTMLVNSVDVSDPATASFGATVPIDIVETVRVYKSPFLAEYGRFSAGVVAVTTRRGGDRWHYELNDPTPEFRIRSGHIHGIRGFTPRFAATGPVARNLFFAGAMSFELRKRPVYPLPFPYNEEKQQSVNTHLQFDYVPRPDHLVTLTLHGVPQRANYVGLNFYTPQPAAPSWTAHEYRAALSDHLELGRGFLLDSTVALSESRARTGAQGDVPLTLTPVTSLGNYPFRSDRTARRGQWVEILSLPPQTAWGRHQIKLGGSLAHTRLHGSISAYPFAIEDLTGNLLKTTLFDNQSGYTLSDQEIGLFMQDGWEPVGNLRLDAGLRADRQRITGVTRLAPRIGIAWMPSESAQMVIRGGFGWFYDRVPLNAYAWPNYPLRGVPNTIGTSDLSPLIFGPSGPGAFAPRSRTWTAAVDQPLGRVLSLHAGYTDASSSGLLVVRPSSEAIKLTGQGTARTQSVELIGKLGWYPEQEWVLSYVYTKALGNVNEFSNFIGDFPVPVIRPDVFAPQAEVIPHRFLTWGVFPLPRGLRFAPVLEWRNGFPYTALDEGQQYAGVPNTRFLAQFCSLDVRISKDIPVRRHKVRLSFSMFNVTDHSNYDAVRLNTADPQFGEFLGRRPRRFRLDFDWLF
jgi:hypothetical protein